MKETYKYTFIFKDSPDTIAPVLMVKKFPILADLSLVIITLYSVCLFYVKQSRSNAFSLYDLYGYALVQKPLHRGP